MLCVSCEVSRLDRELSESRGITKLKGVYKESGSRYGLACFTVFIGM